MWGVESRSAVAVFLSCSTLPGDRKNASLVLGSRLLSSLAVIEDQSPVHELYSVGSRQVCEKLWNWGTRWSHSHGSWPLICNAASHCGILYKLHQTLLHVWALGLGMRLGTHIVYTCTCMYWMHGTCTSYATIDERSKKCDSLSFRSQADWCWGIVGFHGDRKVGCGA